ncbi:MAG: RNA polymerase sporulation sigma factor SigK [Clostridia bacterium]|nr:RNA polymerase sporulation sigma factor SigK [Clostridia bacterium]
MFSLLFNALVTVVANTFFLMSYVTNINSFQTPLKPSEERMYLEQCKNGDKSAKNILIERNLRLVAHVVKKYSLSHDDTDDLISIGTIGLIKAITTFNPDKGTRLATYAGKCIENEIRMHLRSGKKLRSEVLLQDPIGKDKDGNEITLIDKLSNDDESIFDEVNLKIQIKKLYQCMKDILPEREQKVIELRYGLANGCELTQKEIAKMLGISRSYVSRIEKKAIKKLKSSLDISE